MTGRRGVSSGAYLLAGLVLCNAVIAVWGFSQRQGDQHHRLVEPALEALPATLVLVSEATGSEQDVAVEPNEPAAPPAQTAERAPELICRAWGPFTDLNEVQALQASLAGELAGLEIRESEVQDKPDYLVYVDSAGSRERARRVLQELQSQAIESAVITLADVGSALSVGVFSQKARAQVQQARVAAMGYEVAIEELNRSHRIYHLMGQVPVSVEVARPADGLCVDIAPINQFL